jgi:molybdopterin-dependent oxidoreductase alpha subunit
VGITEDPAKVPKEKIESLFGFTVPERKGRATVDTCEGILDGSVKGFISLGGNFIRAVPDTDRMEPAWAGLSLNVQIATKLNRSHLLPGASAWLLPCLGRIERDVQDGVEQVYTTEDSTGCVHVWQGRAEPASDQLLSETAIIAGIAQATLDGSERVPWDAWRGNAALIRAAIASVYPEMFHDMETRMWEPGGFHRPLPAARREWKTDTGKAGFKVPRSLDEDDDVSPGLDAREVIQLMTMRSNDQFNTTVYGYDDRFRGVNGTRRVVFMNRNDVVRLGHAPGDWVTLRTAVEPDVRREVGPLQIIAYDIPEGCAAAYYPECNPLVPLWHHAERSKVPAAKSVPITVQAAVPDSRAKARALPVSDQVI